MNKILILESEIMDLINKHQKLIFSFYIKIIFINTCNFIKSKDPSLLKDSKMTFILLIKIANIL